MEFGLGVKWSPHLVTIGESALSIFIFFSVLCGVRVVFFSILRGGKIEEDGG